MGKRQREWAKRARLNLIADLGGACTYRMPGGIICGSTIDLTIHHLSPCPWDHRKLDQSWRVSRYRQEAKEGKVTVLCDYHNKLVGDRGGNGCDEPF